MDLFRVMSNAIGLMFRVPEEGKVKTRLAAAIGNHNAFQAYRQMLSSVIESLYQVEGADLHGFFDGDLSRLEYLAQFKALHPQKGETLGERMNQALSDLYDMGHEKFLLVGADSPDMPGQHIIQAFAALEAFDVVLGPTLDGGYCLIGMNKPHGQLFNGIRWGESDVLCQTMRNANNADLRVHLLPEWYDIDTEPDLNRWLSSKGMPL